VLDSAWYRLTQALPGEWAVFTGARIHVPDVKDAMSLSLISRSVLGYEERSSAQESRYTNPEVPAYSKPYWSEVM